MEYAPFMLYPLGTLVLFPRETLLTFFAILAASRQNQIFFLDLFLSPQIAFLQSLFQTVDILWWSPLESHAVLEHFADDITVLFGGKKRV